MIEIRFTPWRPFRAIRDLSRVRAFTRRVQIEGVKRFKGGMGHYPPASAPGAWPNRRTSRLFGSVAGRSSQWEATIGSNMFYSIFLRMGTRKMARRKMSDNALREAIGPARPALRGFARWRRGATA